jgi:hypothetical protein
MPTKPADLAQTLAQAEKKLTDMAARWAGEFAAARRTRVEFRGLVAAVSEAGRAESDPAIAKVWFNAGEKMGAIARATDIAAQTPGRTFDFGDPNPGELDAAVSTWRARLAESLKTKEAAR